MKDYFWKEYVKWCSVSSVFPGTVENPSKYWKCWQAAVDTHSKSIQGDKSEDTWIGVVNSSTIRSFRYDNSGDLLINYKGGGIYRYKNVPKGLYVEFEKAGSLGKFVAEHIKGKFEFEKVDE